MKTSTKRLDFSGFTLIELIIVFSVLAILSVISVASFVSYSRTQAMSNDISNIINTINVAKSDASSQIKPLNDQLKRRNCTSDKVLNGFSVSLITAGDNRYVLNEICNGLDLQIQSYPLAPNVTFDTTAGGTNISKIYFNVISGGVTITNLSGTSIPSGKIVLSGFKNTLKNTINICSDGTITKNSCQ